jgi:prephenate dehydrogenase
MNWERRRFEPVELAADAAALLEHGRHGGWITAVLRDADGVRLLGMRPNP